MVCTNGIHLCYSLNVFPDQGVEGRILALSKLVPELRRRLGLARDTPMAMGLWLDDRSALELQDSRRLDELKACVERLAIYVPTLNVFPMGRFHGPSVKNKVYQPDWTDPARLAHTVRCAAILSSLPHGGATISMSTLPGGYLTDMPPDAKRIALTSIAECGAALADLYELTGNRIILAVEPEPDCLWESPSQILNAIDDAISECPKAHGHLGVCHDTCHQELTGLTPGEGLGLLLDAGMSVPKIQLSAAVEADGAAAAALGAGFSEDVYLHQTRRFEGAGAAVETLHDLPRRLHSGVGRWVSHFHVPIFSEGIQPGIRAAKSELKAVLNVAADPRLAGSVFEIETYTYHVLPPALAGDGLAATIAAEYLWALERLAKS